MTTRWMVLFALLAACSSSSSGGVSSDAGPGGSTDCSAFAACGGDLTGTWNIVSVCQTIAQDPVKASCPTGSSTYAYTAQGSYTFKSDGTVSDTITLDATATVQLPAACVAGATSCESLAAPMQQGGGANVQSVTCTGSVSAACTCVMTMKPMQASDSGTYTVSGTSVALTSATGGTQTMAFCVQGNVLKLQGTTGSYTQTVAFTKG